MLFADGRQDLLLLLMVSLPISPRAKKGEASSEYLICCQLSRGLLSMHY
jgi:hypothetical protein